MSNHPDCKGAHRVYADDGCNNAGCRDLDFCVEDCPSCPDVPSQGVQLSDTCQGNHAVDGDNGCYHEPCRGEIKCVASCGGCPDA